MDHLEEVSVEDLQRALDDVEGKKPTQRLLAAIAYKNGITQTELAEWYGVERRTIYSWLKRLEPGSLAESVTDAHRPGRPRKLSESERAAFEQAVHEPPAESGYDQPAWSPELVQDYLEEHFGAEYSIPSCRRLMKEAGLVYRNSIRTASPGTASGQRSSENPDDGGWVPE